MTKVNLDSLGRHNEAIALYNKALTLDPKNADALNGKKQALAALNNQTTTTSLYSNQTSAAAPSSSSLRKLSYVEGKDIPNIKANHKHIRMTLYSVTPKVESS